MVSDAEQWGEGSHADRLERIIARAKQADRLEAQLARECEKRQRLELELTRSQPAASAERAKTKGTKVKVEPNPILEADQTGFNWRDVSNDELNGNRRHDAYHEKLRRSVEAIQEYNAGLDDSDQFAITGVIAAPTNECKFTIAYFRLLLRLRIPPNTTENPIWRNSIGFTWSRTFRPSLNGILSLPENVRTLRKNKLRFIAPHSPTQPHSTASSQQGWFVLNDSFFELTRIGNFNLSIYESTIATSL